MKNTTYVEKRKICVDENTKTLIVPPGRMADHSCKCCHGSGLMKCPRCDGTGTFVSKEVCYYCKGVGHVKCNACNGTGTIKD